MTSKLPGSLFACLDTASKVASASAAFERAIQFQQYHADNFQALPNDQFAEITVFRYENAVLRSCGGKDVLVGCARSRPKSIIRGNRQPADQP